MIILLGKNRLCEGDNERTGDSNGKKFGFQGQKCGNRKQTIKNNNLFKINNVSKKFCGKKILGFGTNRPFV